MCMTPGELETRKTYLRWYTTILDALRLADAVTEAFGEVMIGRNRVVTTKSFQQEFFDTLSRRIWLKGNPSLKGRKFDPNYYTDVERDKIDLHNMLFRRIRVYQFRTHEVRRYVAKHYPDRIARYDD